MILDVGEIFVGWRDDILKLFLDSPVAFLFFFLPLKKPKGPTDQVSKLTCDMH